MLYRAFEHLIKLLRIKEVLLQLFLADLSFLATHRLSQIVIIDRLSDIQKTLKDVDDLAVIEEDKNTAIDMLLLGVVLHAVLVVITADPAAEQAGQEAVRKLLAHSALGFGWQEFDYLFRQFAHNRVSL